VPPFLGILLALEKKATQVIESYVKKFPKLKQALISLKIVNQTKSK
jgi:hypothetical protein